MRGPGRNGSGRAPGSWPCMMPFGFRLCSARTEKTTNWPHLPAPALPIDLVHIFQVNLPRHALTLASRGCNDPPGRVILDFRAWLPRTSVAARLIQAHPRQAAAPSVIWWGEQQCAIRFAVPWWRPLQRRELGFPLSRGRRGESACVQAPRHATGGARVAGGKPDGGCCGRQRCCPWEHSGWSSRRG